VRLRAGATAAIGASPVCLEWSAGRALAAGASQDEIADVLLAIAPVTGLSRIVSATPEVAIALGYNTRAAPQEPDDQ
jgi:alkylhydroperoxidase/carboxymuconolactone decarboxylase family protein YurZ